MTAERPHGTAPADAAGFAARWPDLLERAVAIALDAHGGQRDRNGQPYLTHVLRVGLACRGETARLAGLLHDVVEDSGWTLGDLRTAGFAPEVVAAVDALTRRAGEDYQAFVARAAADPVGREVKRADLADDMSLTRLSRVMPEDTDRLQRYLQAWRPLESLEMR